MENKLKPCPFCGGEAVMYHQSSKYTNKDGNFVHCHECGCRTKLFECLGNTGKTHADTEKEATDAWNNRFANIGKTNKQKESNFVKCVECKYLELELPYGVCSKAYKGMVSPGDSCGKGKRITNLPTKAKSHANQEKKRKRS